VSFGLVVKYLEEITITFQKHYHDERILRKVEKRFLWEAAQQIENKATPQLPTPQLLNS